MKSLETIKISMLSIYDKKITTLDSITFFYIILAWIGKYKFNKY